MTEKGDITQTIISNTSIQQNIGSIFMDSIILDSQFNFISVSQNVLDATGYSLDELRGKSVSILSNTDDIKEQLEARLRPGYFEEEQFEIHRKNGRLVLYGISGFYLGLITDINGVIILKLKNLDELTLMRNRLEAKAAEFDGFVYLSAHDLRGPLATIKGLINLAKISKDPSEMNFLIEQMDAFAEKLDDKLHRLIYFAESDKGHESSIQELSLQSICNSLIANIKEGSVDHPIHFQYAMQDQSPVLENGELVLSLLRNIVLFFCQQPKNADNRLVFDAHSSSSAMEVILRAKSFQISEELTEKLRNINLGYSEILHYPELLNWYAAKKIIFKLKGNIQFIMTSHREVVVLITIPRFLPTAQ